VAMRNWAAPSAWRGVHPWYTGRRAVLRRDCDCTEWVLAQVLTPGPAGEQSQVAIGRVWARCASWMEICQLAPAPGRLGSKGRD